MARSQSQQQPHGAIVPNLPDYAADGAKGFLQEPTSPRRLQGLDV